MIYYDEILYKQAQLKAHYNYYNRQNYNNLSDVEKECFHKVMFLLEQVNELKEAFKCGFKGSFNLTTLDEYMDTMIKEYDEYF